VATLSSFLERRLQEIRMSNRWWLIVRVLCAFAACGCHVAAAAEWSMQPTIQWYFDHDSNRLLTPTNEVADEAAWLTIDALLKRATETGEIDFHPLVEIQRFIGGSELDSKNGSLQLAAMSKGEIYSYSATAQYSDNSTLISELANTGIVDSATRQEAATVSATGTRDFTERQRVDLQGSYADVKYPSGERVGLVGYSDPSVSTTYEFSYSPQTIFSALVSASRVTAPDVNFESRDVGLRAAWAYIVSPTTNVSLSAGITHTDIAATEVNGSIWALKSTHNSELTQWSFSITRDIVPSGFGLLIRRDELDLSMIRSVASRLDATLSALAAHNSDLVSNFTGDNRRYITGIAGVSWHAAPEWVWSFTVQASAARVPSAVADLQLASGWQTALNIKWTPLPWTKSR
jgi:hypothetical protein